MLLWTSCTFIKWEVLVILGKIVQTLAAVRWDEWGGFYANQNLLAGFRSIYLFSTSRPCIKSRATRDSCQLRWQLLHENYRKSWIRSRPLMQVYSIRGRVVKARNPPWFHKNFDFLLCVWGPNGTICQLRKNVCSKCPIFWSTSNTSLVKFESKVIQDWPLIGDWQYIKRWLIMIYAKPLMIAKI